MHFRSKFGDSSMHGWWVMGRTSSKWGKIWLSSWIWPWRSRSIIPQNNRHLNQGLLHLCSKFGDSSLNEWWVIVRTSPWLTHTHTDTRTHGHTDTQTQATTIPEGQNWPRVKTERKSYIHWGVSMGLMQERHNSIANALELCLSCTHPSVGVPCSLNADWIDRSVQTDTPSHKMHHLIGHNMALLTHWGRDKMAAVSQTTLSNAFSWMKMLEFRLGFHWSLFLRFEITIFHHWFR